MRAGYYVWNVTIRRQLFTAEPQWTQRYTKGIQRKFELRLFSMRSAALNLLAS
jgi:hypothetical protein